jgi:hypothetical protein
MISLGSTWAQVEINFPVGMAERNGHLKIAKLLLLENDNDKNPVDKDDKNPLVKFFELIKNCIKD